ncbi:MAG: hypothetical protein ABI822_12940 [Bryobacteraceae bacterium]
MRKWVLFVTMAAGAVAQQPRIVQVDYMKAAPGKGADYRKAEDGLKALHQDRVKKGQIQSWVFYAVRFPGGAAREYDYATVTVYSDMSKLEDPYDAEQRKRLGDSGVGNLRTLLRSDVLATVASAGDMVAPWPWIIVGYIKAKPGMAGDWRRDEIEAWKPVAEAQVKAGSLTGWASNAVVWPAGTHRPYDFISVNGRETFAGKPTPGIEALTVGANNRAMQHGETICRELWHQLAKTAPK